jgi:TfoX/Sxy family transcriptional regulator of competence genes
MATKKDFAEYILDQINDEQAKVKAMFGEFALYFEDKVVGFICDNTLFLKITKNTKEILDNHKVGQVYPGSKDYFVIEEEILENNKKLKDLIVACALDVEVKKKKK